LDAPADYDDATFCVWNGNNSYYPNANGMLIPSSVNVLKAVAFYYDWRHEQGTSIDRVSLALERKNQDGTWTVLNSDTSSYEEKKRIIWYYFYNNTYYRFRLQGQNVTCDSCACGTNAMRVHLAYFYEDSARDDAEGPDGTIDVEY